MISHLPVLVINPHSLCNCQCAMCEIWKRRTADEIAPDQFDLMLPAIEALRVEWVVFSGGEPLLDRDLFRKSRQLRMRGIRTTLLSSGLLLAKNAPEIVAGFDDVIVSLDGPAEIHDAIRGVRRAFELLAEGVRTIHAIRSDFPVSARCTVQRQNCGSLVETAKAARELGLASISFLAADTDSGAFNREAGRSRVALRENDLPVLDAELKALLSLGSFVRESREKLLRIADHFRANLGFSEPRAPLCNAPWVSAVVESDGTVRPCFFHQPVGRLNGTGLIEILNGPSAVDFRDRLRVDENPICRKCVCSLHWTRPAKS